MKDLAHLSLNTALTLGATYADIRITETKQEAIDVKNGNVEEVSFSEDFGFGVRAIADGAWGFAASSRLEKKEVERVTRLAVRIAKASALTKKENVVLAPLEPTRDTYQAQMEIDPFSVSLTDKLDLLTQADEIIRKQKGVNISQATMDIQSRNQVFASSEGSFIEQRITHSGASIAAIAIKDGDIQQRSYPNSFRGDFATKGYEFIKSLKLIENAPRIASEAVSLLSAKECPSTTTDLILDSSQLALQIHESIGHPAELDRVLGTEAGFAGTSFLSTDKLGKFKFGSDKVNITADATVPGGLGTFGYDDEGVKATKTTLVKEGKLVGYLNSRETAHSLNQPPNGAMRAEGWNRIPIIRMTNINLEPGDQSLEEIIEDTKEGVLLDSVKSWSIDDKRLNFQFATEIGWEIKQGKIGQMIKNPNYTGMTPEFWSSCDAIANKKHWRLWGLPNCGKGEPVQTMHVGHGTSPARFRNVKVGVGKK